MQDIETRQREIDGLVELSKSLDIKKYLIVTKDEEEIITNLSIEIQVIPVWKWLLEDNCD